jgi:hypothetical protein
MVAGILCIVLMLFGKQEMVMGGGETGSEFVILNATDQKGDLLFTASFVGLLGVLNLCRGFNQNIFLCHIIF